MGDVRRRAATTISALVLSALVVAPAASALGDRGRPGEPAAAALTGQARQGHQVAPHEHEAGDFPNSIVEAAHLNAEAAAADGVAQPQAATLPTGFADQKVITGMSEAVSADFAPDGTAFVALKTGQIKVAAYSAASDSWAAATDFADLTDEVNNYGDRGLTGIAVDPQFPTRPYVYVNYTYDKDPRDGAGGTVPKWGKGTAYDDCAAPANENDTTVTGCIVQDRVTRLTASLQSGSWRMTAEKELLVGGCYQFSSHASGDVAFGPDGKLYASSGEGASFNTLDSGQYANACGDPADEGGSLRSQDYRTTGDPLGVDGSVFRMDPDTGVVPTQQNASSWLVAYGQRNPWRLTFRTKADGTGLSNQLWSVDVGASKAEEVNRISDVTAVTTPVNRGWPCYEGDFQESKVQPGWDALNLPLCETLYNQGLGAVQKPVFSYQTRDGGPLVTGEDCANETSSVSGVAFVNRWGTQAKNESDYPAAYRNAMFFSDFARSCIWVLGKGSGDEPVPTSISTFVEPAGTPTDLLTGPGGDLYYVDYGITADGNVGQGIAGVHRIVYTGSNATPTARITADKLSGTAPLTVGFSGATSTDPDGDDLTYRWDFENDGTWDATGVTASKTYGTGTYTAKLQVDDGHGHTHSTTVQVQAGNTAPTLTSVTPSASLTWAAGDTISYSATATDAQPGTLTYQWQVEIKHCPSGVCHTHPFGTYTGASGSFTAPPHEYPSKLGVTVTVTDSGGLKDTRSVELSPKTVDVTFASSPSGAGVTVGESGHTAPYTETFIQKAPFTVTAAPTTGSGASVAAFSSWSDGGARTHVANPGTSPSTLTATYTRPTAGLVASPASGTAPLSVVYTASGTNASGVSGGFTYAWDLDGDQAFDDGTGATQSITYSSAGSRTVRVLVTDTRGATDAKEATVTVGNNQAPSITSMSPPAGTTWSVGQTLAYSGAATDPQETLPASAYAWKVERQDCASGCARSTVSTSTGPSGAVVVPQLPYPSHLFLTLTVTDSQGQSTTATRQLEPKTVALSFATDPAGGTVTVAGTDRVAPYALTTIPGTAVAVSAAATRTVGQSPYAFAGWSDGGARSHTITAPATATTYTARWSDANRIPVPSIITDPHTATGPAPLTVAFDASGSTDPDGQALSYAWDLDGDGTYDDATGVTAGATFPVGTVTVGLRVTDAGGLSATTSRTVSATNTPPTVTRVTAYPAGGYSVGQTLGFDAAAVDAQQELPDSAYSFVVLRQDCEAGCPRTEVGRWAGVQNGQYVVPALPYAAHLVLVATVTDAQGASASRALRLDPRPAALTVKAPRGLAVTVDGSRAKTWRGTVVVGSTVTLSAPRRQTVKGVRYVFVRWSDGGARSHAVTLWDAATTIKAVYRRAR
jgi:PKD repeat protein